MYLYYLSKTFHFKIRFKISIQINMDFRSFVSSHFEIDPIAISIQNVKLAYVEKFGILFSRAEIIALERWINSGLNFFYFKFLNSVS